MTSPRFSSSGLSNRLLKILRSAPLLLLCVSPQALAGGAVPPESDPVTVSNLAAREALWPYRTTLVEVWQPEGRDAPLRVGTNGILIRIGTQERARIDFGSAGKYDVPIAKTDLVETAERIRRGEIEKSTPNFTRVVETRLVEPAADTLVGLTPPAVAGRPGFLCIFADPAGEELAALAAAFAPLRDRGDVMTILFPQGRHPDALMRERLRALGWTVPFVYDFLSEPYTQTLLAAGTPMPFVVLQTNEGRIVFERAWSPTIVPALTSALDGTFGSRPGALSGPAAAR